MIKDKFLSQHLRPLVAVCILVAGCASPSGLRPDFTDALQQHLAAVQSRDLPAFVNTLTKNADLKVIFPNGHILESTSEVIDFHREWFADKNWVFEPELIKVIEHGETATALLRYEYRDEPDGPPRSSWLVLIFALEANSWRLVHDQNTRIE